MNDPHENATWIYNYDRGGNITSKVKYAYTTDAVGTAVETIPYVYGDSNWKDKLTCYDGQTITYDAIGNPTNDGTWTYTWQAGRQLKQMSAEGTSVSFKYDHNSMRVQKVVEQSWYPEITNYTYHGKILTHMMVDYTDFDEVAHQDELHFFYDAQSRPAKVSYNGAIYTYVHNLQGDIVSILDSNGSLVVEYKYDAWGKPLSSAGTLADTLGKRNPFRYRGYVFDEETGLYYLRSRYYNPAVGRFVNVDENVGNYGGLFSHNTYAYGANSPVCTIDSDGMAFMFLTAAIGAVTGAVVGGCVALVNGDNVLAGIGVGAMAGGLIDLGAWAVAATILTGSTVATTAAVCTSFSLIYDKVVIWASNAFSNFKTNALKWIDNLTLKFRAWRAVRTISQYTPTITVMRHTDRPYQDMLLVMQEIIKAATPIHDASGGNIIKWVVKGAVQIAGKIAEGNWELVLDDKAKKILHFLFKS